MKYVFNFLLFAMVFSANAQDAISEVKKQAFGNPYNAANENFINLMNEMASTDRISLLLFDRWVPMEMIGKDSTRARVDSANYHIETDRIVFFNQGQFYQLFPERIDHVHIGERTFISAQYLEKKQVERAYFEVLEQGEFTLLQRHAIERKVTNNNPMGLPAAKEVEIKQSGVLYYLTSSARRPVKVPSKKRDLILTFKRNRAEMAIFAGENRLSAKRLEDVRALFAHYNSLQDPPQ